MHPKAWTASPTNRNAEGLSPILSITVSGGASGTRTRTPVSRKPILSRLCLPFHHRPREGRANRDRQSHDSTPRWRQATFRPAILALRPEFTAIIPS